MKKEKIRNNNQISSDPKTEIDSISFKAEIEKIQKEFNEISNLNLNKIENEKVKKLGEAVISLTAQVKNLLILFNNVRE